MNINNWRSSLLCLQMPRFQAESDHHNPFMNKRCCLQQQRRVFVQFLLQFGENPYMYEFIPTLRMIFKYIRTDFVKSQWVDNSKGRTKSISCWKGKFSDAKTEQLVLWTRIFFDRLISTKIFDFTLRFYCVNLCEVLNYHSKPLTHLFFGCDKPDNKWSTAEYPLNSFPPSAAYIRQWIGSALVQIMACRLFDAEPLSKPMLGYSQLDPYKEISVKF